jgi:glycine/D-amino acid oxidase-like deaminating enzyme
MDANRHCVTRLTSRLQALNKPLTNDRLYHWIFFLCTVVDFLIVGQGICGTLLSFELYKRQRSFLVLDPGVQESSSYVASGLINPVTGKRLVKSWRYEDFVPVALFAYRELERMLHTPLLSSYSLLQFHKSAEACALFESRISELPELSLADSEGWSRYMDTRYGVGEISPCYTVDSNALLSLWRKKLQEEGLLMEIKFSTDNFDPDCLERTIPIAAERIIFCDGAAAATNPYFSKLPFSLNKGEAVVAHIPNLPDTSIYGNVYKIVPMSDQRFWIGSSFGWQYDNVRPTEHFRTSVERFLNDFLRLPYQIEAHFAAERPSSVDYRPFVGMHPVVPSVGIFNGMGTKGYSQAPFFAMQLADHLCGTGSILPEADISRFRRILSFENR